MNEIYFVKIGYLEIIYFIVYYENKIKDFYFLGFVISLLFFFLL